jgi:hypothetical protein
VGKFGFACCYFCHWQHCNNNYYGYCTATTLQQENIHNNYAPSTTTRRYFSTRCEIIGTTMSIFVNKRILTQDRLATNLRWQSSRETNILGKVKPLLCSSSRTTNVLKTTIRLLPGLLESEKERTQICQRSNFGWQSPFKTIFTKIKKSSRKQINKNHFVSVKIWPTFYAAYNITYLGCEDFPFHWAFCQISPIN